MVILPAVTFSKEKVPRNVPCEIISSQDKDESGTLIMIATDGTQHPPLQFPPGGHLMQVKGANGF